MVELPDPHEITSAQTLRMLALQETQIRELSERVKLQDELLEATVKALALILSRLPGNAPEVGAELRDLLFDHKKLIDRAQPL